MFKRIRRIVELSKKDPEIPNAIKGDGKAVFFGEGTEEEFIEQERKDSGIQGWYDRLKKL